MPKWKKDAREFEVHVTHHEHRGYQAYLPKPIMEKLGDPKSIKFVVRGDKIEIQASDQSQINDS